MQRGNGAVIGKQNTPTTSVATGVWALNEVQRAVLGGNWPAAVQPDPYFEYNTLLLHGNGTNGAQNNTFLDSSTNNFTITRNGNTTQGTFTPYGSNWSNYFKSGDYLGFNSNSAFNMNTYCCLEAWVCYTSLSSSTLVVGRDSSYWIGYDFAGIGGAASKFVFSIYNTGASWQAVSSTTSPVVGVWYHVVGIKDNTTLRIYINGVQENTATFSGTAVTTSNVVQIAANQGTQPMVGYISNTRLVLGASASVLPYTGNFTPPTAPLTAVSGTAFLTCQSNRFVDNSSNAFSVIVNNTPSVQRFSPFNPTTPYAAGTIGGSGYFDGSGDYLSVADNAAFSLSGGDYTIEGWLYMTANTTNNVVLERFAGGTGPGYTIYVASAGGNIVLYGSSTVISGGSIPLNAWTHFAFTRSGSTTYLFVNGALITSNSNNITDSSQPLYIGSRSGSQLYWNGYISNLRIVKGTAVYTSAFTPPTAPLTAITNTSLLANFTNGGIIDNAMMNDLETVGNAQISTSVSKFGGGSLAFDGTGDYLVMPNNPQIQFGSADWTVEGWLYPNSTSGTSGIVSTDNGSTDFSLVLYRNGTALQLYLSSTGSSFNLLNGASVGTLTANTWQHFAVCRSGATVYCFLNGVLASTNTITNTSLYASTIGLSVGGRFASENYNGYIDDLRITKGYARYTAAFTPPTLPFPDQ